MVIREHVWVISLPHYSLLLLYTIEYTRVFHMSNCVCVTLLHYIVVVAITVLMDIIQLGLYFDDNQDLHGGGETQEARTWQFSAGMMILSLLLKPLTIALAVVAAYLKSGASLPFLGTGMYIIIYSS